LSKNNSIKWARILYIKANMVSVRLSVWTKIGQCRGRQGRAGRPGKKTWEILGYGFQDMVFRTWDLNFGAWIFTLAVSKIET
jgi:hypothetical protein